MPLFICNSLGSSDMVFFQSGVPRTHRDHFVPPIERVFHHVLPEFN